jgi:hypothetical protein
MLRHESRFDLLDPGFYWNNVIREHWRYGKWFGGSLRHPVLWPRVGIWLLLTGVPLAGALLWRRARRGPSLPDRLLLAALPLLVALMAVLLDYKRYVYLVLVLPFLALYIALAIVTTWRWAAGRDWLWRLALGIVLVAAIWEGAAGVLHSFQVARSTTPYLQVTQAIADSIPAGSRVLAAQPFWLGLVGYDMRSINLVFVLSDPHYRIPQTPSIEQAIDQVQPDYIVSEDLLVEAYAREPEDGSLMVAQWHAFARYLNERCSKVDTIVNHDYSNVSVYRCGDHS